MTRDEIELLEGAALRWLMAAYRRAERRQEEGDDFQRAFVEESQRTFATDVAPALTTILDDEPAKQ
jgi:hypothetical protein